MMNRRTKRRAPNWLLSLAQKVATISPAITKSLRDATKEEIQQGIGAISKDVVDTMGGQGRKRQWDITSGYQRNNETTAPTR